MAEDGMKENESEFLHQLGSYFPLKDNESVKLLFADQLQSSEPNLAVLSLVCGYIEHHLTWKTSHAMDLEQKNVFPVLDFSCFCLMYKQYIDIIRQKSTKFNLNTWKKFNGGPVSKDGDTVDGDNQGQCNVTDSNDASFSGTSREVIKNISDFIWGQLSTSYFKDRPHIQNLYSFLNGKRLDCFGVALIVVMTAQHLGLDDVHLSLSEDHAWVIFGRNGQENAEVTWHGKRDEIKRGTPIGQGSLVQFSKDWLYLGGHGMKCDRSMEVAAIVSAMNPGINSKTDSQLLSRLQQELLWYLFDHGYLDRYPMAICNLADLEEIESSRESPSIEELYRKAIHVAETKYSGYHVYPYTYYGGYLHRQRQFSKATEQWRCAAMVAARYTHSREDEELYKDLNEVANTFFPEIMKNYMKEVLISSNQDPEKRFFDSVQNLVNIVNFYDGVCLWEEGSTSTAIHSEWAKNFSKLLSLFPQDVRATCRVMCAEDVIPYENENTKNVLRSRKMNLVLNLIGDAKIKSQIVDLHLTSQAAFESKSVAKRLNDKEAGSTARRKRYKL